jgi:hypothetical protein
MKKEKNDDMLKRVKAYREDGYSFFDAKRMVKKEEIEALQQQLNTTWNPFKRTRLLVEMVEMMNLSW